MLSALILIFREVGQILRTLVGYQAHPSGVQALACPGTCVLLFSGMKPCKIAPSKEAAGQPRP